MTITTDGTSFHDPEEQLLHELSQLIDNAAQRVCRHHYHAYTQEPPTTSRLAQAIEMELERHPINVNGLTVEVGTQDMPDRGSKMEKLTGADLYICLVRRDRKIPVSKGMLVQAKWDKKLTTDRLLPQQAARMMRRTRDSYIWVYTPDNVLSLPAASITGLAHAPINIPTVGELIADGLRCNKGDERIGRDLNLPRPLSMNTMLDALRAEAALEFTIENEHN